MNTEGISINTSASQTLALPKLLVSVRDVSEAEAALAGGADWIDLKEPQAGSLGAVCPETARAVVKAVANRGLVSAALGELTDWTTSKARDLLGIPEIQVVKLGLSDCDQQSDWPERWQAASHEVARFGKQLVAVVYADNRQARSPAPQDIVREAIKNAFQYLLIDTFDKDSGPLLSHLSPQVLAEILRTADRANLQSVVAGGLTTTMLAQLPQNSLDVVAVRGGVCVRGRSGVVQQQLVEQFSAAIQARWQASPDKATS